MFADRNLAPLKFVSAATWRSVVASKDDGGNMRKAINIFSSTHSNALLLKQRNNISV